MLVNNNSPAFPGHRILASFAERMRKVSNANLLSDRNATRKFQPSMIKFKGIFVYCFKDPIRRKTNLRLSQSGLLGEDTEAVDPSNVKPIIRSETERIESRLR